MRLIFVSKDWKFNSDSETSKKMLQKIDGFFHNLAEFGNGKFSLLNTRILVVGSQRVIKQSENIRSDLK